MYDRRRKNLSILCFLYNKNIKYQFYIHIFFYQFSLLGICPTRVSHYEVIGIVIYIMASRISHISNF